MFLEHEMSSEHILFHLQIKTFISPKPHKPHQGNAPNISHLGRLFPHNIPTFEPIDCAANFLTVI